MTNRQRLLVFIGVVVVVGILLVLGPRLIPRRQERGQREQEARGEQRAGAEKGDQEDGGETKPAKISQGPLKAAFDAEFLTRPDGYQGMVEHYGFRFPEEPRQMDPGLMYKACADGDVDVIDAFATDGRIPAYELQILEDDKGFFPPYYAAPLVRASVIEQHSKAESVLNRLAGRMSNRQMRRLNYRVDEKGREPRDVAREFLISQGLLEREAQPGGGTEGPVTVGSKHFTEQEILGEMMALMLEYHTDLQVNRRLNLGGTMICFNALKAGDLGLYAEYTGTGLVNILKRDVIADPDKAYEKVKTEFKERYDLVWLKPFGFNNTYTLTMRRGQAEALGIETISDLAEYINRRRSD
ncbi:MAG: glycine betaine ABC transporter substrate-binding protein [Candidatus Brocadiia bacterium]